MSENEMGLAASSSDAASAPAAPHPEPRMGAAALAALAPTAEAAVAPDWHATLPDAVRPLAQAKGWKSPADAVQSYAHLERLIGAERLALPPKDAKGQRDWSRWDGWAAIGRPESPERYAFRLAAGADGAPRQATEADREFQHHMAPLLHRAGLAQWQVDLLSEGLEGFGAQHRERGQRRAQEEFAAAETELRRDWDQDYDRHLDLANRAVRRFGGPELARALGESGLGRNPAVVRAFARIGAGLAEDGGMPSEARPGAGGGGARAEIQRLKADTEFQQAFLDRLHPGHEAAMARMLRLQGQALPDGGAE